MGVREFEALGPMLRAVAAGPKRCAGDVVLFGPRSKVERLYGQPVEAEAPVDGAAWGALLTGVERLGVELAAAGRAALAMRAAEVQASAPPGSTVAVEWHAADGSCGVHLLVERPAETSPAPPVPGPQVFPTERALLEACAERCAPGALVVVGDAAALRELLGPGALPTGFVAGRNRGAGVADAGELEGRLRAGGRTSDAASLREVMFLTIDDVQVFEASELAAVMVSSLAAHLARVEGAERARVGEAVAAEAARRAGPGRLLGESEQRAAVAWAESLTVLYEASSDDVTIAWGDGFADRSVASHLKLPHVGSLARPWCFEGAVRELLRFRAFFAPEVSRVAFFVGAILCRVWTATGGSAGGPALVRLDDGERRADVLRVDESAGGGDE